MSELEVYGETDFSKKLSLTDRLRVFRGDQRNPDAGTVLLSAVQTLLGGSGGTYTDKQAERAVAAALRAGAGVSIVYNDPAGTITITNTAPYSDQAVRDVMGLTLVAGSGISVTVDNVLNKITIASTITQYTNAMADARIVAMLVAGDAVGLVYNSVANTLTISTPNLDQRIRTTMSAALIAGTGITLAVNGVTNAVTISSTTSAYTDQQVRNVMAATLVAGTNISITVDNVANTITIAAGGGAGAIPRDGAVIVASSEAPAAVRTNADFNCTGTNDDVKINSAILLAAALVGRSGLAGTAQAGMVQLTGGAFMCTNSVLIRTGVTLCGMGTLTELRAVNMTASTGSGAAVSLIKMFDANAHVFAIRDMWLSGNGAAGGAGHALYLASTTTSSQTDYPGSNPDGNITISNLFIRGFSAGTRHGVWISTDLRASLVHDLIIRDCSGHGIFLDAAADGHITNTIVANSTLDNVRVDGGNWTLANVKVAYAGSIGFNILNARTVGTGLQAQDCATGFSITGADVTLTGISADTSSADGIVVSASRVTLTGFNVFVRSGGRYATQTNGFRISAVVNGCKFYGTVNPANITNKVVGAANAVGVTNAGQVDDGSTMVYSKP